MLYILTALKCEASVLNGLPGKVIVTGVGSRAAEAIDTIGIKPSDKVLNVGICAGEIKGNAYLVNQVISQDNGRRFYPDILFESGIEEMPLTTVKEFVNEVEPGMLYDMEGSIICEKVLKITAPSDLAVFKVVSDNGNDFPTPKEVTELIRAHLPKIRKVALSLLENDTEHAYAFLPETVSEELRLTQYMRNELKDIEHYCAAAGRENELLELLGQMRESGRIPVKDKRAGREVLDEIYSYLR